MNNKEKYDLENTVNNAYFNKLYKKDLEMSGEISCAYCPYNKHENRKTKYYGGRVKSEDDRQNVNFPNWKLVSKNRKQWMKKPKTYKVEVEKSKWYEYYWIEIKF
jgi:hypothetical protein